MIEDELIDLISESIYRHLHDGEKLPYKAFINLTDVEKNVFWSMAHDIVNIFDDYYDAELDEDELIDDDEDIDDIENDYDDPYEEETRGIDDW
jgi:hypothetical protein